MVVTPSSIPTSATQGPEVNSSPYEGSKAILEDYNDKLIMKTRVSDSNEATDDEHRMEAIGTYFPISVVSSFSSFPIIPCTFSYLPSCYPCHVVTDVYEEPKTTTIPTKPTTPIP